VASHLDTIERYYHGCNTADTALMVDTFHPEVVHYFVDHAPVSGAENLARYWASVGPRTKALWRVDHALVGKNEAVIEWSMEWSPQPDAPDQREILHGTEWFIFVDGQIREVRSYHNNHRLQSAANRDLWDFPYSERGYFCLQRRH
jgi:hypothetical protein